MKPEISIIIPTYNSSLFLERTAQTIIDQTFKNWECLLIDDDSEDGTMEIINRLCNNDNRLKKITRKTTIKGANNCRNSGVKLSEAEYLLFVDADDLLAPDCLQNRILFLKEYSKSDMLIFNTIIMNEEENKIGQFHCRFHDSYDLMAAFLKHQIQWQTMSVLWKKTFLEKIGCWNEDYLRLQDVELNIRALNNDPLISFSKQDPDSFYRLSDFTEKKKETALWGFAKLIDDFYPIVFEKQWNNKQEMFMEVFSDVISNTVKFYISQFDHSIISWEKEFIRILKKIKLNNKDISKVREVFKFFNNQTNVAPVE